MATTKGDQARASETAAKPTAAPPVSPETQPEEPVYTAAQAAQDAALDEMLFGFDVPTVEEMEAERQAAIDANTCKACGLPLDSFTHNKLLAKHQGAHARQAAHARK